MDLIRMPRQMVGRGECLCVASAKRTQPANEPTSELTCRNFLFSYLFSLDDGYDVKDVEWLLALLR